MPRLNLEPVALLVATLTFVALFFQRISFAQTQSVSSASKIVFQNTNQLVESGSRKIRIHDPSTIVKCKNEYWIFYTGRGIPSYHSKDLVTWESGPRVFTNAPAWTEQAVPAHYGTYYWAPDVIYLGDHYLLYYAISTFGKQVSAIGLATNPTLDPNDSKFQWTDQGMIIQSTTNDNFNAIDPAISQDGDGKVWMAFGSFWSGIKLVELNPKTNKRIAPDSTLYSLAHFDSIEASYICRHENYYYLFVNWGLCCKGINSTYNIRVGRSNKITGPYFDKAGVDLLADGGSLFLDSSGSFIGPGHAGIISEGETNWFSCHFYDGTQAGRSTLAIFSLRWNTNGWPEIVLNSVPKSSSN
jgi:arabinan endo-1,5-alpha-L-arabinosidase